VDQLTRINPRRFLKLELGPLPLEDNIRRGKLFAVLSGYHGKRIFNHCKFFGLVFIIASRADATIDVALQMQLGKARRNF
jgi:hypothetical protein